VIHSVLVTVAIQSVSKCVAEDDARQGQVARAGCRLMAPLGLGAAAAFLALAPLIARFEHDPALVPYLRISAAVVLCYGLYSVFVGIANGRREFHKQAGLDMAFLPLRLAAVLRPAPVRSGGGG